jgi:hypothetical protein
MIDQQLLRANEGKYFEFKFADGEKTVGKLVFVDMDSGQFIYEMSATTEPTRYQNRLGQYSATFAELATIELLDRE